MNSLHSEALIVHGGGITAQEELTEKASQRMDTAISAWQNEVAPNIVTSGGHSFLQHVASSVSEAEAMKRYAISQGVPEKVISKEESSLDTIGNALFTKTEIVVPKGWEHLTIVTSESHLPRAIRIFEHVFGKDFEIKGLAAPEHIGNLERIHEHIGYFILREVIRGTKSGDDEAIKERLFDLVPGYGQSSVRNLVTKSALGLIKRP